MSKDKQRVDPEDFESAKEYEAKFGKREFNPYAEKPKKPLLARIFGWLFVGLIVFVYLFWIGRIILAEDPKEVTRFIWTDERAAAYNADPEGYPAMVVKQPTDDLIDPDGRIKVSAEFVDTKHGTLQITARWNNATARKAAESAAARGYGDGSPPQGEPYVFALTDEDGNMFKDYTWAAFSRGRYNYRVLIFYGVDFSQAYDDEGNPKTRAYSLETFYAAGVPVDLDSPDSSLRIWSSANVSEEAKIGKPEEPPQMYPAPAFITAQDAR
ncbi:MAG TPA: hypothetical protein GX704_02055 [Clostridiales bacterium]|jgi:hypothetical protein|nr:hypothetical protein [Clostridiales bacterium]